MFDELKTTHTSLIPTDELTVVKPFPDKCDTVKRITKGTFFEIPNLTFLN